MPGVDSPVAPPLANSPTSNPSTQAQPNAEDGRALDWAKQNPNDPRSVMIIKKLREKFNGL